MDLLLLLFCIFSAWTVNDPFCRSSSTLFVGCLLPISVFPSFLSSLMFPLTQFMSGHRFWSSGLKENGVCFVLFPFLFTLVFTFSFYFSLPLLYWDGILVAGLTSLMEQGLGLLKLVRVCVPYFQGWNAM